MMTYDVLWSEGEVKRLTIIYNGFATEKSENRGKKGIIQWLHLI